jgi:hypothetical protein
MRRLMFAEPTETVLTTFATDPYPIATAWFTVARAEVPIATVLLALMFLPASRPIARLLLPVTLRPALSP